MLYNDPIVNRYLALIKSNLPDIKAYFQAEPFKIPASQLPAVFIVKTQTEAAPHTNAEDAHRIGLRLTLVTDIRQEISDEKQVVAGVAKLYELMEGRDSNYKLKPQSILNILRSNIHLDTNDNLRTDLGSLTRVDYGDTYNARQQTWFIESHIHFIANFTQAR